MLVTGLVIGLAIGLVTGLVGLIVLVLEDGRGGGLEPTRGLEVEASSRDPVRDPVRDPAPAPGPTRGHLAATATLVADLERALRRRDAAAARALAVPPRARRLVTAVVHNAARLGVTALDLRPLTEAPAPSALERRHGPGAWVSSVQVTWRYAGIDRRSLVSTARLVLVPGPDGAALAATRPALGDQTPGWLLEPVEVRRRQRVLVTAPDATSARRLATQAADAAAAVRRRLPGWEGDLVLEAPSTVPVLRAATGVGAAGARSLAAVTTTADGSITPGSPQRVFVNPRVFPGLAEPAQGIVLRHEATHVATAAAASAAPLWVTEGFADWVALADSRAPVRSLASQVRSLVRTHGAPRRLPGRSDFAADAPGLGAAYEAAWLAVRLIARTHGDAALLRFRRLAASEAELEEAFRVALGTSEAAFTREWRRELVGLTAPGRGAATAQGR